MQNDDKLDNVHNGSSRVLVDPMVKATLALTTLKSLTEKLHVLINVSTSSMVIEITIQTLHVTRKMNESCPFKHINPFLTHVFKGIP